MSALQVEEGSSYEKKELPSFQPSSRTDLSGDGGSNMPEKILVSACLLGIGCRYDGKEKENPRVKKLLENPDVVLIPVCPEQLGGLSTPRTASERSGDRVINQAGEDVTVQYQKGAEEALKMAKLYGCKRAILKERSPSCGCGIIYDGSFSRRTVPGNGVTAELFLNHGISVFGESVLED